MDWVEGPAQLVCVRGLILDSDYRILFQCLSDETRLKPECTIQGFWWSLQPTAPESAATNARLHCELSREDSLQNVCTIFEHLWTCSDLLHCNCSSNHRRFARPVTGIHDFVRFRSIQPRDHVEILPKSHNQEKGRTKNNTFRWCCNFGLIWSGSPIHYSHGATVATLTCCQVSLHAVKVVSCQTCQTSDSTSRI